MPYFEHQSGALKEQEPVSESLRVPWMKLGAQLCPHPKLLFILHKGLQKGLTRPVSFEQEDSHRSFWKGRAKGGTKNTRKLSVSKHIFSSMSLHWSLKKAFLSLLAILWNSAFRCLYLSFSPLLFTSLLFTAVCKASSDSHFAFLHFFFLGMGLLPVSCTISRTSVHSSSGTLSIRSCPLNLFLTSNV